MERRNRLRKQPDCALFLRCKKLEEAQDNDVFVCGMQSYDVDDLMHGVIITRRDLECPKPKPLTYGVRLLRGQSCGVVVQS
jgi:hypothetical protein